MRKYIIILAIVSFFTSCKERMEIDLEATYPRLIVDGRITTDDTIQRVKLTQSANYFDNKPVIAITKALVFIIVDADTIKLNENIVVPGVYETSNKLKGVAGKTYKLVIHNANVGNETTDYSAETTMPNPVNVSPAYVRPVYKNQFAPPGSQYCVKVTLNDNAAQQDNYVFRLFRNGNEVTDSLFKVSSADDRMWNGSKIDTTEVFFIMYDYKLGRGSAIVTVLDSIKQGDKFVLETSAAPFNYLQYIMQMQAQYAGSSPIGGGPPANVITNILPKDKSVGFFTALNIIRDTLTVK